ncbi:LiaF domain-containing protein [Natribacillus halophilus]|uniref:Predicted membrane protein n=1 Tax=Natribacillus halophilus TaxID=549003 RepID=A0A1G8NWY3_9BACI|nr:LiaF domain-containing protein [Natribacillus halophilus]SDI84742.1 Predicted membrane protein [Natribacillus halophilus]
MNQQRILMLGMTVLGFGLIFNFIFAGAWSPFAFILPLIFAVITLFSVLNRHESAAYFFMVLSAALMVGYWTTMNSWLILAGVPVLFLLLSMFKKPVREIDVDKDFTADEGERVPASQSHVVVPKQKWVILGDYKLKKQAFSISDELELNIVLGSATIDLSRAIIEADSMDIAVMNVLGDAKIKLPQEWSATVEINTLLGSVKALGHQEDGFIQRETMQVGHPDHAFGHFNLKITTVLGDVKIHQPKQK